MRKKNGLKPLVGTTEQEIVARGVSDFFKESVVVFFKNGINLSSEKKEIYGKKIYTEVRAYDINGFIFEFLERVDWPKKWRAEKCINAAIQLILNDFTHETKNI